MKHEHDEYGSRYREEMKKILEHPAGAKRISLDRRVRRVRRWFYFLKDDGLDLASLIVGVVAVLFIVGAVVYQVSLYLHKVH